MNLGDKIKKVRKVKNMTQSDLAQKAGISRVSVGNYERNERIPNAEILMKLAGSLDVHVSELLETDQIIKVTFDNSNIKYDKLSKLLKNENLTDTTKKDIFKHILNMLSDLYNYSYIEGEDILSSFITLENTIYSVPKEAIENLTTDLQSYLEFKIYELCKKRGEPVT